MLNIAPNIVEITSYSEWVITECEEMRNCANKNGDDANNDEYVCYIAGQM